VRNRRSWCLFKLCAMRIVFRGIFVIVFVERGTVYRRSSVQCERKMGAGAELKYAERKRERLATGDQQTSVVWYSYLGSTRQFHHGFLLVWPFSPIVIVPSLFSLSFVAYVVRTHPCLLRPRGKTAKFSSLQLLRPRRRRICSCSNSF
jgi:hypothetical protein